MTAVKICGLRRVEDAVVAAEAGATMLGFVFASSRRRIEPEAARETITAVRQVYPRVHMVGVFVNESPDIMNRIATLCDLDYLQLGGDEGPAIFAELQRPAIKTLHVGREDDAETLLARARAMPAPLLHLDTAHAGIRGGTGRTFDWSVIPALDRPFLLAGGLDPENVSPAVAAVRPWGIDVSSGVESDGEKDQAKIRAFIAAARTSVC